MDTVRYALATCTRDEHTPNSLHLGLRASARPARPQRWYMHLHAHDAFCIERMCAFRTMRTHCVGQASHAETCTGPAMASVMKAFHGKNRHRCPAK